ncbi:MAG: hypothetical protein JWM91_744, partial [Rhodospirillales bacterium]|nr:hypothetical protein [Rhodospirillales bacterium]
TILNIQSLNENPCRNLIRNIFTGFRGGHRNTPLLAASFPSGWLLPSLKHNRRLGWPGSIIDSLVTASLLAVHAPDSLAGQVILSVSAALLQRRASRSTGKTVVSVQPKSFPCSPAETRPRNSRDQRLEGMPICPRGESGRPPRPFGTVVILPTIRRHAARRPLRSFELVWHLQRQSALIPNAQGRLEFIGL